MWADIPFFPSCTERQYVATATENCARLFTPPILVLNMEKHCPGYFELVDKLIAELVDFRYRGRWVGGSFLRESYLSYGPPRERRELAKILGAFLRQVSVSIRENQSVQHYVEDTPFNILYFNEMLELLPEAKLVHIYGDPRDVIASLTKQP